jgi:hypothetical protein
MRNSFRNCNTRSPRCNPCHPACVRSTRAETEFSKLVVSRHFSNSPFNKIKKTADSFAVFMVNKFPILEKAYPNIYTRTPGRAFTMRRRAYNVPEKINGIKIEVYFLLFLSTGSGVTFWLFNEHYETNQQRLGVRRKSVLKSGLSRLEKLANKVFNNGGFIDEDTKKEVLDVISEMPENVMRSSDLDEGFITNDIYDNFFKGLESQLKKVSPSNVNLDQPVYNFNNQDSEFCNVCLEVVPNKNSQEQLSNYDALLPLEDFKKLLRGSLNEDSIVISTNSVKDSVPTFGTFWEAENQPLISPSENLNNYDSLNPSESYDSLHPSLTADSGIIETSKTDTKNFLKALPKSQD